MSLSPSCDRRLSPLNIPELLQLIFSFLDRSTIAEPVVRVCRQWFLLNQHRLHREVAWDVDWRPSEPQHALRQLPGAKRLVFRAFQDEGKWRGPDIQRALRNLQTPPSILWSTMASMFGPRNNRRLSGITEHLHQSLREVALSLAGKQSSELIQKMQFPPTLQSLKIDCKAWLLVDVGMILDMCPFMETLHISSNKIVQPHHLSHERDLLFPDRPRLRSLVFRLPLVHQRWMEDFLKHAPNLEELQLIAISKLAKNEWDWPRFSRHLQELCLPLKQFHYSAQFTISPDDEQEEAIFLTCPTARERTFISCLLTPKVVKRLMDQSFALTTLEITFGDQVRCHRSGWLVNFHDTTTGYTAQTWHHLLCKCPSLRHLKTLKMPYTTHFMDIHRRLPPHPVPEDQEPNQDQQQNASLSIIPGIWICRGLETLDLEAHIHEFAPMRSANHHTRIVYGYVSRVCPRLQDLRIAFPNNCMAYGRLVYHGQHHLQLHGGLCLLARLRHLERLRVGYRKIRGELADMNWLCKSGRREKHRARRRRIVSWWEEHLGREAELEADRLRNESRDANNVPRAEVRDDNGELVANLKNLGLLQDVKDMVEEMDTSEFICLPELQLLACGDHLEQHPEKEIRSIFYINHS